MKLHDLVSELLRSAEVSQQVGRLTYIANLEALHEKRTTLPGKPSGLSSSDLRPLMPKKVKLDFQVGLSDAPDGTIDANFSGQTLKRRLFRKNIERSIADVAVEWDIGEVPEVVCRIRDHHDDLTDGIVKKEIWQAMTPAEPIKENSNG